MDQVIANLISKFDLQNTYLDKNETWSGILAATEFLVLSTYHTMLQVTSVQLVFVCDMILNNLVISNGGSISICIQQILDKNKIKLQTSQL